MDVEYSPDGIEKDVEVGEGEEEGAGVSEEIAEEDEGVAEAAATIFPVLKEETGYAEDEGE